MMERLLASTQLPFDYILRKPDGAARVIVLLHGFQESAERIFKKFESAMPADAIVLAVNGLFPMPERRGDGYRVGFSWYFYDREKEDYYIDMKPGLEFLESGIRELALGALPMTVVGFSQGGYIAPFLAQRLGARHAVGICSEFLADEMEGELRFQADLIAGADDDVVPLADVRESNQKMRARGVRGALSVVEGSGHKIDEMILGELLKTLSAL